MKLEIELTEKYAEKLEQAKEMDPTIEDRLLMRLESEAMENIVEVASQAEQAQEQAMDMGDMEMPSGQP